jgi:hypothetical protein
MPKPPAHQRPIPVNRARKGGRPGTTAPRFGKPEKKTARPEQMSGGPGVQINLKLPKLPFPTS